MNLEMGEAHSGLVESSIITPCSMRRSSHAWKEQGRWPKTGGRVGGVVVRKSNHGGHGNSERKKKRKKASDFTIFLHSPS